VGSVNKLNIKEFHDFMRGAFKAFIARAYQSHQIFCEADLHSLAWWKIRSFLEKQNYKEETPGKFRVLNKPFLEINGTYPDLVVFRRTTPWAVIELKEGKVLRAGSAKKEWDKLIKAKKDLGAKRGYLVYVARSGPRRAVSGPKGEGARYFFEVPVILQESMTNEEIEEWKLKFKPWARYRQGKDLPSKSRRIAQAPPKTANR
jgi:hypothetical protein